MKYSNQNNMNDTLKYGSDFTEKFGKSTKKPIFELLRTKNKLMKGFSLYFKSWAIVLSTLFLGVNTLNAQCTITWDGSPCVGAAITFTGSASGTTHDWTFEDASGAKNTSTGQRIINYAFQKSGVSKITYITTINGTKCTATLNLTIKDKPKIKIKLVNLKEQCFEKNLFCFDDSTANANGAKMANIKYVISDGQLFEYTMPPTTMPNRFCFSIKDQRGGSFNLFIESTDENGCQDTTLLVGAVKVREKIGAMFTSNKPVQCDSVQAVIKNISSISQKFVKSITWYWGDGTTDTSWGPNITHWFRKQGVYNSKMIIQTVDGCVDSFKMSATATVFKAIARILADKDSTCISSPNIKFSVDEVPSGATGLLWNFGDPNSGPQNQNNKTWSPEHAFTGLGPFLIKLTYKHPICGDKTAFDTIIILGPSSAIESAFQRVADYETFQCPKDVMDTVHFRKNLSTFYHNDRNFTDDDSTFYKAGTTALGHNFQWNDPMTKKLPKQIWQKPLRDAFNTHGIKSKYQGTEAPGGTFDALKRERVCATRLWDFGDNYAPKCTTDTKARKNINVNCAFSRDSVPNHYYRSWDLIMLSDFKNAPMEDAIFIDSNGLCKRTNVYPDSIFYIIQDSLITVPNSMGDIITQQLPQYVGNKTTISLRDKGLRGISERYIEDYVDMKLNAGDSVYVGGVLKVGPQTISLKPKNIIKIKSKSDSVTFQFTVYLKKDTLPMNLLKIRLAKGERPKILDSFKRKPLAPLKMGFDYFINYKRFRELYYAKIPACNNVKLTHKDTCHPMKCESEAIKQLSMLHANAGGVGSGMLKDAIECLGSDNPSYGVTFILSDLKPGCTFTEVKINYDTFCGNAPGNWTALSGLSPGGRPLNPPLPFWNTGYQLAGNPPNRFSQTYNATDVCNDSTSCITVGIIVGNGIAPPGGNSAKRPLCADTQYYDNFACFPMIDPSFEMLTPTKNKLGDYKICKYNDVVVRPIPKNKTRIKDLKSIRWQLFTGNASPYFSLGWRQYIQEDYFLAQKKVPGKNPKYLYNYMVQTRGVENPRQVPCSNEWTDGVTKTTKGPDTIFTAEIRKYTIGADVSAVWENIKTKLEARGFDPFALADTQIAKMIWNNKGVIGNPKSGAYGCIDTTGFGKFIRFYNIPDPNNTTILHYRDTTIQPLDSVSYWDKAAKKTKKIKGYKFNPRWSGYHFISVDMTSSNGKCNNFMAMPIVVGFAMDLRISDTLVCQDAGNSLTASPDFRYFSTDPQNIGTFDPKFQWNPDKTGGPSGNPTGFDYWRDPSRQTRLAAGDTNVERFTRWDWNKKDDGSSTPFGGAPYGAVGAGTYLNPWKQLGGGGIYYQNDSGVFTFRLVAGDSTGCMDTITKRVFISRLDVEFSLKDSTPACNTIIEFFDKSKLFDPCNWAIKNCNGPQPISCDFVKQWTIDWGDGIINQFKRKVQSEPGLPNRIAHKYTRNGWFQIKYELFTQRGCSDTFSRWVKIPGPRPRFEYTTKAGRNVTICEGDSVQFTNMSDSASRESVWTWFFGDNELYSGPDSTWYFKAPNGKPWAPDYFVDSVWHTYKKPGVYHVKLEQYDKLVIPPNINRYCPAVYPDTPSQQAFIITVLPRDSVRGKVLKPSICPGDSNTFVDNSDTTFATYKWRFVHYSRKLGKVVVDTLTTGNKTISKIFTDPGVYRVTHLVEYKSSRPRPYCPTVMADMFFTVDSVIADFDIDSSGKPDFVFTRKDVNGVEWRWGFGHQNDIVNSLPNLFIENIKSNDKSVKWSYDSSGRYWACLIVKNATGCEDTICKEVVVDLFVYLANVFTPNISGSGDGKNDKFRVPIQGHDLFEIRIFNRWGERVFFSEDSKVQWNGKVNNDGADCPSGTYFYQLEYRFKGKDKINHVNGSVNLIREN
jgi:gliding motility-associated-like protein